MYGGSKIKDVISDYSEEALDKLAADKVDEVANLRLPRTVLTHEVVSALSTRSYIAKALARSRPPAYAFLKLLLDAPNHELPIEGFKESVVSFTDDLTERAAGGEGLAAGKNYSLYLKIVRVAWENDGVIDRSEELILEELRNELGIPTREHLLLEHHPDIRPFWENDDSFNQAKQHLLSTGLVLNRQDNYLIAREVVIQIREIWGIELDDASYTRLLDLLTTQQLRDILDKASIPLSGSKEERTGRILLGLISPKDALDTLHIDDVRSLCKKNGLKVTAAKADLISSLIEHFARGRDLEAPEESIEEVPQEIEPEDRVLTEGQFVALFQQLTIDQLYDILRAYSMRLSGSKSDKIQRLLSPPFSESTLLKNIRNSDLASLCRRLGIRVSGVKEELIDRLVSAFSLRLEPQEFGGPGQKGASPVSWDDIGDGETPPSPPNGLHGIQADYPELDLDESIVLALLKEARSLTEQ